MKLQIDGADRSRHEIIDIAVKAFEHSQSLREKWFAADYAAKRRILEVICVNWTLDGASLVPKMRKPFDRLAEGLVSNNSRGDRTAIELFRSGIKVFAWQSSIIDVLRSALRYSLSTCDH